jgi:hypothetical protein
MRVFSVGVDGLPGSRAFRMVSRIGTAAVLASSLLAGATAAAPASSGCGITAADVAGRGKSLAVPVAGVSLEGSSNASSVVVVIKSVSATAPGYLSILQLLT